MRPPFFIGDEVTAAGFRLAGLRVAVPEPGHEETLLEQGRRQADLVLITAEAAGRIPRDILHAALRDEQCPVVVVPDARGRALPQDLAVGLRRQLGLAE